MDGTVLALMFDSWLCRNSSMREAAILMTAINETHILTLPSIRWSLWCLFPKPCQKLSGTSTWTYQHWPSSFTR